MRMRTIGLPRCPLDIIAGCLLLAAIPACQNPSDTIIGVDELPPELQAHVVAEPPVWFVPDDPSGDMDGDGINDLVDNCPGDYNESQADADGDSLGDVCDELGIPMDEFSDPNLVGFET